MGSHKVDLLLLPSGSYMTKSGDVQFKLGQADKQFQEKVHTDYITPIKAFLEVDIKAALVSRIAITSKWLLYCHSLLVSHGVC